MNGSKILHLVSSCNYTFYTNNSPTANQTFFPGSLSTMKNWNDAGCSPACTHRPGENSFLGGAPFVFPVAQPRFLERDTPNETRGCGYGGSLKIERPGRVLERRQNVFRVTGRVTWRGSQLGLQTRLLLRSRWRQDCRRFRCSTRLTGSLSWFLRARYLYEDARYGLLFRLAHFYVTWYFETKHPTQRRT